jgi:hypothetical protein
MGRSRTFWLEPVWEELIHVVLEPVGPGRTEVPAVVPSGSERAADSRPCFGARALVCLPVNLEPHHDRRVRHHGGRPSHRAEPSCRRVKDQAIRSPLLSGCRGVVPAWAAAAPPVCVTIRYAVAMPSFAGRNSLMTRTGGRP